MQGDSYGRTMEMTKLHQGKRICTLARIFWILDQNQSKIRNPKSKMAVSLINACALGTPFAALWRPRGVAGKLPQIN
jgi:hypothetical protein